MIGIIFVIIGYILGSLSSAIIVCKAMGLTDPRLEGSKNPGTTNVLRTSGKLPAILVLLGDILKGFIPVILAKILHVEGFMLSLVALAAVIGHIFPVFFQFKGGKGVATTFGALLGLNLTAAIIILIVWLIIMLLSRYVSLASIIAAALGAVLLLFMHNSYFLPFLIIAILIIWRHWPNIERLRNGTENKLKFS